MTQYSPLPNNRSGVEPGMVDPIDDMLSALTDAELTTDELVDLEEFALDNDQTLDQLTAPFHSTKSELLALLDEPAPEGMRTSHLSSALDAMNEPEVLSLAAARASRGGTNQTLQRSQKLNRRLRGMSAVAASFVVVAGIGVIALQGGLGGSDDSATESANASTAATETTAAASSAGEDATFMERATDDGAMAEADATEEGEASANLGPEGTTPSAAAGPSLVVDTPVQDLTLKQLSDETGLAPQELLQGDLAESVTPPLCQPAAVESGITESQIQRGLIIEQGGTQYELIVLSNEELLVFELPDCVQLD